jgi:hypothetical protein
VRGSKRLYVTKKTLRAALYWPLVIFTSFTNPSTGIESALDLEGISIRTLCIANVGPVEETDQVQQRQPWYESQIELPEKTAVLESWSAWPVKTSRVRTILARSCELR